MTIETVPGSDTRYFLINFDKDGRERLDDPAAPNGRLSDSVAEELAAQPYTDVFFMSHGWQGDVPAAKRQYDAWAGAMLGCTADIARLRATRPGFKPLLIGIHWPSLPWGDEDPTARAASFAISFSPGGPDPMDAWIDDAAAKLADTPAARAALRTIFTAAQDDLTPDELPPEVVEAYRTLQEESGIGADGPGGAPGDDIERFDPESVYQEALEEEGSFGVPGVGALLAPLRQLSFWQMKGRARSIGEGGAGGAPAPPDDPGRGPRCTLPPDGPQLRLHRRLGGGQRRRRGLTPAQAGHSMLLAQGAVSLWAYCSTIPGHRGTNPGYFHPLIAKGKVAGPVVTTQLRPRHRGGGLLSHGRRGRRAGGLRARQLPKYGGRRLRHPGPRDRHRRDRDASRADKPTTVSSAGRVYNLEASAVINEGGGWSAPTTTSPSRRSPTPSGRPSPPPRPDPEPVATRSRKAPSRLPMDILEITLQHRRGDQWPVVAEHRRPGELPGRSEGQIEPRPDFPDFDAFAVGLNELLLDPRAYGTCSGQGTLSGPDPRPLHGRPPGRRQRRAAHPAGGGGPGPANPALGAPVRPGRTRGLGLPGPRPAQPLLALPAKPHRPALPGHRPARPACPGGAGRPARGQPL
jgi:hypothetical protein